MIYVPDAECCLLYPLFLYNLSAVPSNTYVSCSHYQCITQNNLLETGVICTICVTHQRFLSASWFLFSSGIRPGSHFWHWHSCIHTYSNKQNSQLFHLLQHCTKCSTKLNATSCHVKYDLVSHTKVKSEMHVPIRTLQTRVQNIHAKWAFQKCKKI